MEKIKFDFYKDMQGQKICCDSCLEKIKNKYVLTEEDRQIIEMVFKLMTNKQIADFLNKMNKYDMPISQHQVGRRLKYIYELHSVNNRMSFVMKILKNNLFDLLIPKKNYEEIVAKHNKLNPSIPDSKIPISSLNKLAKVGVNQ